MRIAITHTLTSEEKFQRYVSWIKAAGRGVEAVPLSYRLANFAALQECQGLILTGGHDVDPALYGGPAGHPKIVDVDRRRDDFECGVLGAALGAGLPVLGICRGLQLANVWFGGSLIPDLETDAGEPEAVVHRTPGREREHTIVIERDSLLGGLARSRSEIVNSSHHQAAALPGKGLRVVARAADGVIEALELDDSSQTPFFLLVQWHPERMSSPLSVRIGREFLSAVRKPHDEHLNTIGESNEV